MTLSTLSKPLATPTFLYRFFDTENRLLYVGISYHVERRFDQHRYSKPWHEIARIEVSTWPTRQEAEWAEREAIETERPAWNITHNPLASGDPNHRTWWASKLSDGEWWWTRRPISGFTCKGCLGDFEDRPAIMRYLPQKDPTRWRSNQRWADQGWCMWLEHDCGWMDHRIVIDDVFVNQLGSAGGGWERLP